MVREFGLSPALGPVGYAMGNPQHLGAEAAEDGARRPYSEYTQRIVDEETARLVRHAEGRATALLRDHRAELDTLADLLTTLETVDGAVVLDVLHRRPEPRRPTEASP